MAINRVLCVCLGNSDRSPVMAAVLQMYLKNAGHKVSCCSAGVSETGTKKGGASLYAITAMKRLGIDLTEHRRQHVTQLDLNDYDLFVVVNDQVAGQLLEYGVDMGKMFNAQITNPWPCQFQEDYDGTARQIMAMMYMVVSRYFPVV